MECESVFFRTDVTSIKINGNYILAGIGGQLHFFDKNDRDIKAILKVFDDKRKIHGIMPNSKSTQYLLYGENRLRVFLYNINRKLDAKEIASVNCDNWILNAKWINHNSNIVAILMNNNIILWTKELKQVKKITCQEHTCLHSAFLAHNIWDELVVLSGTILGHVAIWCPKDCNEENLCDVLYKLEGHKGIICAIHYNSEAGIICSATDEGVVLLWSIPNKNLLTELSHPNTQIKLLCKLNAHKTRVFKCQVLENYIITSAKDSLIYIWSLGGSLIRKFETHQGTIVWSMDCDEHSNIIATGGGDSGITLHPIHIKFVIHDLKMEDADIPTKVVIMKNNGLATLTENGSLKYFCIHKREWIRLCQGASWKIYSLLEISNCRNTLALVGYPGIIEIFKCNSKGLNFYTSYQIQDKSRIYSFHWLTDRDFLTCGLEGKMHLWNLSAKSMNLTKTFTLPPSKERWTTAACMWSNNYIVVGDRPGNIYLYSYKSINPIQSLRKTHSQLGISNLYFKDNKLMSLGRNCVIKRFVFDKTLEQLTLLSYDKFPCTWLSAVNENENVISLLSFLDDDFVIWDYKTKCILMQFYCGGCHRSWDFSRSGLIHIFAYIKDKKINLVQYSSTSYPIAIVENYQANEINICYCFEPFQDKDMCALILGGEDATMRISTFNVDGYPIYFSTKNLYKRHLSSIQCIIFCNMLEGVSTGENINKYMMISAGGRAQIILWEVKIQFNKKELNMTCDEKYSFYESHMEDSETKIMDLCSIEINKCLLILAACSDGTLNLFSVIKSSDDNGYKIIPIGKRVYKQKCIIKIWYLKMNHSTVVMTVTTDGEISFWDFSDLVNYLENLNSAEFIKGLIDIINEVKVINSFQIHKSGIKSFNYQMLENNICLFLCGGDDNTMILFLFHFITSDKKLIIEVLLKFCDTQFHSAPIIGTYFIDDKYFLTVSANQELKLFKWKVENNIMHCDCKQNYNSVVTKIQGMQCFKKHNIIYSVLYGKGLEICKIRIL